MILDLFLDGLYSAIAAIGFGAISHPPLRAFKGIAILAAVAHTVRFAAVHYFDIDIATASFLGAFACGFLSLLIGKWVRCPLTVLYIPALLPLIPGKFAYKTIFALIMFLQQDNTVTQSFYMKEFFYNGVLTATVIFLLAFGATFPRFIFPTISNSVTRNKQYRNQPQDR